VDKKPHPASAMGLFAAQKVSEKEWVFFLTSGVFIGSLR
jgi:hypothetical protein